MAAAKQSGLTVRAVEGADFAAWSALWAGYNAFYGRSGPTALAAHIVDTTWARFFERSEPVHALVAERDGVLLGLAHYVFHRSTISVGPACYLQDLYTSEAARGAGVGRALIDAVAERARAAGATRYYWQTHESNASAMRLYDALAERTGFIVYRKPL